MESTNVLNEKTLWGRDVAGRRSGIGFLQVRVLAESGSGIIESNSVRNLRDPRFVDFMFSF